MPTAEHIETTAREMRHRSTKPTLQEHFTFLHVLPAFLDEQRVSPHAKAAITKAEQQRSLQRKQYRELIAGKTPPEERAKLQVRRRLDAPHRTGRLPGLKVGILDQPAEERAKALAPTAALRVGFHAAAIRDILAQHHSPSFAAKYAAARAELEDRIAAAVAKTRGK